MNIKSAVKNIFARPGQDIINILNKNNNNLLKYIRQSLNKNYNIIVLYFDIVRFREVEQCCGSSKAEKILLSIQEKIQSNVNHLIPNLKIIQTTNLWGDDFIIIGAYKEKYSEKDLQEITLNARVKLSELINSNIYKFTGQELELYAGYTVMSPHNEYNLKSRLYSAIKDAQDVAKGELDIDLAKILPEFKEIINNENLNIVFQPIISLNSGHILGWESLVRGPENSSFYSPGAIFNIAEKTGMLYMVEKICRKKSLEKMDNIMPGQKLFLNIHPRTIVDPGFKSGETLNMIKKTGLNPENIVFEITERHYTQDYILFNQTLRHYRKQGYMAAVDDMGAGFSNLHSIAEIKPDYIKLDMSLVRDIHRHNIKKTLIETFNTFAEKINCRIIAEGIETMEELETLADIGVHYGQGFLIARPSYPKPPVQNNIKQKIIELNYKQSVKTSGYSSMLVKNIAENPIICFNNNTVKEVKEILDSHTTINEIVVIDNENKPQGLLMRYNLDRLLSSQYGIPLYYNRPVYEIMDKTPLIIDEKIPIEHISQIAMNRETHKLYDSIIITKGDHLAGIITIQKLLDTITRIQIEMAKSTNPLTGLPGNLATEQQFYRTIQQNQDCAVIYLDMDNFKPYNDSYGFENGDKVILFTANLVSKIIKKFCSHQTFLGHIGGDDFVLILHPQEVDFICQKITRYFDRLIIQYYNFEDRERKTFQGYDRDGKLSWFPILSISLAVIDCSDKKYTDYKDVSQKAAQLKKYAKSLQGSVYVYDRRNN